MADPIQAFGRARPRGPAPVPPKRRTEAPEPERPAAPDPLDAELRAWKQSRPRPPFPWRQVCMIGGLCLGAGSLVLPDSVADAARYALYAVAGIGFFGGLWRSRRAEGASKAP